MYKPDNIIELRKILLNVWDHRTGWKVVKKEWGTHPRSKGQCFVTALLVKDIYGGHIVEGKVNNEKHFWNIVDGIGIDLTSDQYGGNGLSPVTEPIKISRYNFYKKYTNKRYELLLDKYVQYVERLECSG